MTPLIVRSIGLLTEVFEAQVESGRSFEVFKYVSR